MTSFFSRHTSVQGAGTRYRVSGVCMLLSLLMGWLPMPVAALGTAAGTVIPNSASMHFSVDGTPRELRSNVSRVQVDEILDVVVVAEQADPVAIDSPTARAVLSFLVTNTGNGNEDYRLFLDTNLNEGGFDPTSAQLFIEHNGTPGLQTGAGGDLVHVEGAGFPFEADGQHTVYVTAAIPASLSAHAESRIRLRAVAATLVDQTGVDDPSTPGFPSPGAAFANAGDGGSTAVVGLSHASEGPVFFAISGFRVDAPVVTIDKTAIAVQAPDGTSAVRPGSVVAYQLKVEVRGSGSVDNVVLRDLLPPQLAFVAGSLSVNGSVDDDDLEPAGLDDAGFVPELGLLQVSLGTLDGTTGSHLITFSATIR